MQKMELSRADLIWNRSLEVAIAPLLPGDKALHALSSAHCLIMNGGVLHAVEVLDEREIAEAQSGYKYFDLVPVTEFIGRARKLFLDAQNLEEWEIKLDKQYFEHIPDDDFLFKSFELKLVPNPNHFAPIK
jgi:hypothetical protein